MQQRVPEGKASDMIEHMSTRTAHTRALSVAKTRKLSTHINFLTSNSGGDTKYIGEWN